MKIVVVAIMGALLLASSARAQYLFLDTDGSGLPSAKTSLSVGQDSPIDIWLVTDKGRDGQDGICTAQGRNAVTFFSYEFILRSEGGAVEWKGFKNSVSAFSRKLWEQRSSTEFYVAYSGEVPLPPGKYRLGRLMVRGLSGEPRLRFTQSTEMSPALHTSFGSDYQGKDGDYTLKFAEDPQVGGPHPSDVPGDWSDADGIGTAAAAAAARQIVHQDSLLRFRVYIASNTGRGGAHLVIWTRSGGRLLARLFDVRGRLVRTLLDDPNSIPGRYDVPVIRNGSDRERIASGVYFYRVEGPDGDRGGRVVVLK